MRKMKRMLGAALALALLGAVFCPAFALAEKEQVIVLRICNWEEYIDQGEWEEDEVIDLRDDEEEEETEETGEEAAEEAAGEETETEAAEDGEAEAAEDGETEAEDAGNAEEDPEGRVIFGENSLVEDFETWFEETYGKKVRVEYSTFGTNEDLYNMLTIGDVYDLVCPSEYMIMKLMAEDKVQPLSEEFFDEENEYNYYIKGVSPYIRNIFETHEINGSSWDKYAAGYMWGITGFVYNPDRLTEEEASTWKLLENTDIVRQITIKDNVRDSYFAAVGAIRSELLTSESFKNGEIPMALLKAVSGKAGESGNVGEADEEALELLKKIYEASPEALNGADPEQITPEEAYALVLQMVMNDTSAETVKAAQEYLQDAKDNLYSFETDSGKADMITGKVVANYQWSGDAVYTMDQADEDDYTLNFAIPEESTNIYFDGWIMLKSGIDGDSEKQQAAEAFINFLSRPDNVIRNMYYIGYTSAISGGEDSRIFDYLGWNYGAEDDGEETAEYNVGYFFTGETGGDEYVLTVPEEQLHRQLSAQYPSEEVIKRASIMEYFDEEESERINRMWIRVRCFNIGDVPAWAWIALGVVLAGGTAFFIQRRIGKKRLYE